MNRTNKVTRDELFARVEVLKLAHSSSSGKGVTAEFDELWGKVMPDGRYMDQGCGCGGHAAPKPSEQTFTGTHVVPFGWVKDAEGVSTLYVMDLPLYRMVPMVEFMGNSPYFLLQREGTPDRSFMGEHAQQDAMQAAHDEMVAFLNANVDSVAAWIEAKRQRAGRVSAQVAP